MTTDFPFSPPSSPDLLHEEGKDFVVGVWMNDSKFSKLPIKQLSQHINILRVNTVEEAMQCSLLLHKVLDKDVSVTSDLSILNRHPGLLYPLESVVVLNNRRETIQRLLELQPKELNMWKVPETVDYNTAVKEAPRVQFPLIAKPESACSDPHSHTLHLVTSLEQLWNLPNGSFILQRFIHHSSLLLKVYIIGDSIDIILKASLSQDSFDTDHPVVFDSQSLKQLERPFCDSTQFGLEKICVIARDIQQHFALDLLGVDMIVEEGTSQIYVVDVNYFPGFSGVHDLDGKLLRLLLKEKDRIK